MSDWLKHFKIVDINIGLKGEMDPIDQRVEKQKNKYYWSNGSDKYKLEQTYTSVTNK